MADAEDHAVGDIRIFSMCGRIGRLRYIFYMGGIFLLFAVAYQLLKRVPLVVPDRDTGWSVDRALLGTMVVGLFTYSFLPTLQRLHDLGTNGWLALPRLLLPLIPVFWLVLAVAPETAGHNRFGLKPPENTWRVKILAGFGLSAGVTAIATLLVLLLGMAPRD